MFNVIKKMLSSDNEKLLKSSGRLLSKINYLEQNVALLSDYELQQKTLYFKKLLIEDKKNLDDILCEAFAVVREGAKRILDMRHFDVQIIGGTILHKGMIAEMKTGEGKTLVATLPAYLNALQPNGVHVVTANEYLAKRDAEWMGKLYRYLGLTVNYITSHMSNVEKKAAYNCDITYGTGNEFGFDYLRDNTKYSLDHMVQRKQNYAIVDEVDDILIDDARTPLILSGPAKNDSNLYHIVNKIIKKLNDKCYIIDEKTRSIMLTDYGNEFIENLLKQDHIIDNTTMLYDESNAMLVHNIDQALRAHKLFKRDVDYIIKDNKVIIIDEFKGRIMSGRRYSDGLHQAIETKENVEVQNENQVIASITFQNYFRLYTKLAGMTGTAMTEAKEFAETYNLNVVQIPTNVKVIRIDEDDAVYRTSAEKYDAIIEEIINANKRSQPVLVGTVSIEKSEHISKLLKKREIKHNVLNAKHHTQEAYIIAQAGRPCAVTIATNMAGRGTDIKLGGDLDMLFDNSANNLVPRQGSNDISFENTLLQVKVAHQEDLEKIKNDKEIVKKAGGLLIIGTERHESRRIDDQLRGRAGRQGDEGRSKFFLSLDDGLMKIFGSDKISSLLSRLGLKYGEAIVHPWISKSLEKAQRRVEGRNYEIRKNLLQFDDVISEQRKVIYNQRLNIMMHNTQLVELLDSMMLKINTVLINTFIPKKSYKEEWDTAALEHELNEVYGFSFNVLQYVNSNDNINRTDVLHEICKISTSIIETKKAKVDKVEKFDQLLQRIILITIDQLWKEHLYDLEHLRSGINLRAYAQKNPLHEYKIEAFHMFQSMLDILDTMIVQRIAHLSMTNHKNLELELSIFDKDNAAAIIEVLTDASTKIETNINNDYSDITIKEPSMIHKSTSDSNKNTINKTIVYPNEEENVNSSNHFSENNNYQISRNKQCYCGSGKKFKHCHGAI